MFVYIPGLAPEGGHRARGWEIKKRDISCEPGAAGATEDAVGNANFQEFTPHLQVGA